MTKRISTKRRKMIYETLHIKLKTEQHEHPPPPPPKVKQTGVDLGFEEG